MPSSAEATAAAGPRAWLLFALGWLLLPSLLVFARGGLAPRLLDAQPGLVWSEPWRCWSAAWVHWSALHLGANAAGTLLLAALGWTARVPLRAVSAWALAWPLVAPGITVLQPALAHYGGLSGVLHAGVAVVTLWLLSKPAAARRERLVGLALLVGLLAKLVSERFWLLDLRYGGGWDIAVVPLAHAVGVASGLLAGWLCLPRVAAPAADRVGTGPNR